MSVFGSHTPHASIDVCEGVYIPLEKFLVMPGTHAAFGELIDKADLPLSLCSGGSAPVKAGTVFVPTEMAIKKFMKRLKKSQGADRELAPAEAHALVLAHACKEPLPLEELRALSEGTERRCDTLADNPTAISLEVDPKTGVERYTVRGGTGEACHILALTEVVEPPAPESGSAPTTRYVYTINRVINVSAANFVPPPPAAAATH